ncbi:MAG: DeoR/GlpR family DNA-binding transcription regulator [Pseudomonadota bacterium]
MYSKERQKLIYRRLEADGQVVANELAAEFDVSEDSIRRDLREMAAAQQCERVYGGALKLDRSTPMRDRQNIDVAAKQLLAQAVVKGFSAGMSIFIDASSTNLEVVRALPSGLDLTIFTNAPSIAAILADDVDTNVILIGGRLTPGVGACVDSRAVQDATLINPDLYVMGVCGLSDSLEVTAEDHDDAVFKRIIAERASQIVLPVTKSKLGRRHRYTVLPVNEKIRLIAANTEQSKLEAYLNCGCEIEIVSDA